LYAVLGLGAVVAAVGALHVALLLQQLMVRRRHELAIRLALGASRWRLVRHVLVLGALVAVTGVTAGTVLAQWGSRLMLAVIADRGFLPVLVEVGVTGPVLAVSATLAVLLTMLSSLASCVFVVRQAPTLLATAATPRTTARIGIVAARSSSRRSRPHWPWSSPRPPCTRPLVRGRRGPTDFGRKAC
jgi:hypothetical protein